MDILLAFLGGLFLGTILGVVLMAAMCMAGRVDNG